MDNNNSSLSKEDARLLIKALRDASGSFGKFATSINSYGNHSADEWQKVLKDDRLTSKRDRDTEKSKRKREKEDRSEKMERATGGVVSKLKMLEGSSEGASAAFSGLTKMLLGGATGVVVESVLDWSSKLVGTYRDLTSVGASFTGGLFGMSQAAAHSGLSLDKYADLVKKNSDVFARYKSAGKDLGDWSKSIRSNTYQMGMYGYSVDGLNDLTMEFMRRQASFGKADTITKQEATQGIEDLAKETTGLAKLFGKSREDITKTATEAMSNGAFMAEMQMRTGEQFKSANKALQEVITGIAAMPGSTGKMLSEMTAEAVGFGTSVHSEYAQNFAKVGMGAVIGLSDQMAKDMQKPGADQAQLLSDFNDKYEQVYQSNLQTLKVQAVAGNAFAKEIIQNHQNYHKMSAVEIRKAMADAEIRDKFTQQMLSLDGKWGDLMGTLREKAVGIFQVLVTSIENTIEAFKNFGGVEALSSAMTSFGDWLDKFLNGNGDAAQSFGATLANAARDLADFMKNFSISGLVFNHTMLKIAETVAGVGIALYAIKKIISMAGEGIASKLLKPFKLDTINTRDMNVRAGIVNVHGPISGGNGGSFNLGDHDPRGPKGPHDPNHKPKWHERFRGGGGRFGGLVGGILGGVGLYEGASGAIGDMLPEKGEHASESTKPGAADTKIADVPKAETPEIKGAGFGAAGEAASEVGHLGFMKSMGGMLGRFGATLGKLQIALTAADTFDNAVEAFQGKKSTMDAIKDSVKEIVPAAMGLLGGEIGGAIGGMTGGAAGGVAGSVVPGAGNVAGAAVGAIGGEFAGGYAGYSAGEALGDKLIEWAFGPKGKSALPASPKDPPKQEDLEMAMSLAKKELSERQSRGEKNNDDLNKKIEILTQKVQQQTEIMARQGNTQIGLNKSMLERSWEPYQ